MNEAHLKNLFLYTSQFPEITFTFYNQNFDFTTMQVIVVKNKEVIEEYFECQEESFLNDYGLKYVKNVLSKVEVYEDQEDHEDHEDHEDNVKEIEYYLYNDPRNIQIYNEISRIFYDEEQAMVGGLCFGPTLGQSMGKCSFGFQKQ